MTARGSGKEVVRLLLFIEVRSENKRFKPQRSAMLFPPGDPGTKLGDVSLSLPKLCLEFRTAPAPWRGGDHALALSQMGSPFRDSSLFGKEWRPLDPPAEPGAAARESCTMTAVISGVVGGGCGLVLGGVLVPFGSALQTEEFNNLPMKQQFRRGMQEVGTSSRSWGKNLAVIGAVFSCTECFVEKARGRSDRWNPVAGGCITGAVLAHGSGPTGMAFGCGTFAAFSYVIEALGFGQFE